MTASTCKSSALILCTSECLALSADGNASGFDFEVTTFEDVSLVN